MKSFFQGDTFSTILQAISAICLLVVTIIVSYYQINKINEEKRPFLFVSEINHEKVEMTDDISDFSKINYYMEKGSNEGLTGAKSRMIVRRPEKDEDQFSQLEKAFLEEASQNSGDKAYFTYFNSNPVIMLNFVSNKERVVIEHYNTSIKLHNYGALITKMRVKRVKIQYSNSDKDKVLEGVDGLDFSRVIDKGEDVVLMLDEATTNLENTLCYIDEESFNKIPIGTFDLLKSRTPVELKYKKMIFEFEVWNQYNEPYNMDISVTHGGNTLVPETELKSRSK